MLDFGDIHVLLIKIIINSKVEIISDNIILNNFYFWSTRRLFSETYQLFAKPERHLNSFSQKKHWHTGSKEPQKYFNYLLAFHISS